jgi:hypothetical protein
MAVSQIKASFQNDGNFSQLDLQDIRLNGPVMRIETFRCSQPCGEFGVTAAGSSVEAIAGEDHLQPSSNRTFRHVFSVGPPNHVKATLEIREVFSEDGSLEVITRDIDGLSRSFGAILIARSAPIWEGVSLHYEVRRPDRCWARVIKSPVTAAITEQIPALLDLSKASEMSKDVGVSSRFEGKLLWSGDNAATLRRLDEFAALVRESNPEWTRNVKTYERMGDFRDKCIHDGTNLIGDFVALASEYVLIRAYRMSLITLGKIFDLAMSAGADRIQLEQPLMLDTKPGVYAAFLSAYAMNIGLYQLGIDKVHSDYGSIPMKLRPGSRLENGAKPIADATNLNRMLALLAALYYVPAAVQQVANINPVITSLSVIEPALSFAEMVAA